MAPAPYKIASFYSFLHTFWRGFSVNEAWRICQHNVESWPTQRGVSANAPCCVGQFNVQEAFFRRFSECAIIAKRKQTKQSAFFLYNCPPPDSGESVGLLRRPPGQLACLCSPLPTFCHLSPSVHSPLRSVRKRVLISFCPCPPWASLFYFHFAFARTGQMCFRFLRALLALGKPFIFLFHLCPR